MKLDEIRMWVVVNKHGTVVSTPAFDSESEAEQDARWCDTNRPLASDAPHRVIAVRLVEVTEAKP